MYFADENSCANKIRSFLDLLLTELGVPETPENGGFKSLDVRIEECKRITLKQKDILELLKNIGNEGSHGKGYITKYDLYRTYKIIEALITKLYKRDPSISELKSKFCKYNKGKTNNKK